MNVILYTLDFEPITIVDLPMWMLDHIDKYGGCTVSVKRPITKNFVEQVAIGTVEGPECITIRQAKLKWHDDAIKTILVTEDEELALSLKPEWLPGQRLQVQNYETTIDFLGKALKKELKKNNLDDNL
ncbi:MAG: hypothetical protein EBT99_15590 [Betaproteobacteria bacterium]|nr:hypothetical protein [Betaproteobacteria bacterium]NDC04078.1 hypothetical protein [Betaproteobacteria bacterium]